MSKSVLVVTQPSIAAAIRIPMRHFTEIMRGCLLKGAGIQDLAQQMIALAVLGIAILALAVSGTA